MKKTLLALVLASGCSEGILSSTVEHITVDKIYVGDERQTMLYFDEQNILRLESIIKRYGCEHDKDMLKYFPSQFSPFIAETHAQTLVVIKDLALGQRGYADVLKIETTLKDCSYALVHVSPETEVAEIMRTLD